MKNDASKRPAGNGSQAPRLLAPLIMALSVVAMVGLCLASAAAMMNLFSQSRPLHHVQELGLVSAPDQKPLTRFPKPNLELDDGHADSTALAAQQKSKLNTYGWVDRSNNIVHLPIERAMDLLLAEGFPTQTQSNDVRSLQLPSPGGAP